MRIMVEGDTLMRRPYIVMEPAEEGPGANVKGARMLADFLLSDEIQKPPGDIRRQAVTACPSSTRSGRLGRDAA